MDTSIQLHRRNASVFEDIVYCKSRKKILLDSTHFKRKRLFCVWYGSDGYIYIYKFKN